MFNSLQKYDETFPILNVKIYQKTIYIYRLYFTARQEQWFRPGPFSTMSAQPKPNPRPYFKI